MVAGDEEFVGERMGVEPGEGVIEFVVCTRLGEVTCVDENVAFRERRLSVVCVVCVGYANEADGACLGRARGGRGTIEPTCKENKGQRYEAVPVSGILTMDDSVEAHNERLDKVNMRCLN